MLVDWPDLIAVFTSAPVSGEADDGKFDIFANDEVTMIGGITHLIFSMVCEVLAICNKQFTYPGNQAEFWAMIEEYRSRTPRCMRVDIFDG